jgi:hypothetical protein
MHIACTKEARFMSQSFRSADTAADLRAEMARRQVAIYRLAPAVGLHPSHLGQVLSGRRPLTPELAERIERALIEGHAENGANFGDAAA